MRARGVAAAAADATRRSARSVLAPQTAPLWIAAILALALAIAFVTMGGLRAASRTPDSAVAGSEVRTSLYAVTVRSAEAVDVVEDRHWEAKPGQQILVMSMRLENLTDHPVSVIGAADRISSRLIGSTSPLLTLAGVDSDDARTWRDDGGSGSPVLQPGVPAEVMIGWPVPAGSFSDGEVRLDVHDAFEESGQIILSSSAITWRRTELAARITVGLTS